MLISAQRAQQLRVAIVEGTLLKDYQVDITDRRLSRGNIYRGVVANIQPSLNAAFIDIGEERHGFLPVSDVLPAAFHQDPEDGKRKRIDQVLTRGKTILVQVTKDGIGQKGSALTTNISLAGRYLVLTPFDDVRGISRKAEDDGERKKVRERLKKLNLPDSYGVIVRTNGIDQNQTTLNRDLSALIRLWRKMRTEINKGQGPRLLYSDQDLVVQALRDYLDSSIEEVVVDDDLIFEQADQYMQAFMPRSKTRLTRYKERLPLFSRYRLETQIDHITERSTPLPSGGSIVIDSTEALTAIDVNSGRATHNENHDESIFNINAEAAREVARQLRLRDIGGLVVVDFIDMRLRKHRNRLEKEMRDAMKIDKARYSVGRLSPNGLLEINRQRIKQALKLRTHRPCPTCDGVGTIASPEFAALSILGRLESRVATGLIDRVTIAVHPELADTLQNSHRQRLATLETELGMTIEIISAPTFDRMEERIDWHQREGGAAVAPVRAVAALSSSDLATQDQRRPPRGRPEDRSASEADDESRPRKRRRRRRSSSRDDRPAAGEFQTESGTAAEAADGNPPEATEAVAEERQHKAPSASKPREEESTDEQETRPRRRRSRRRRRKPAAAGEAGEAAQTTQESPEQVADKAADRAPDKVAVKAPDKAADKAPDPDQTSNQNQPTAGSDSGSKPSKPRRRRTRRRRKGPGGGSDIIDDDTQPPLDNHLPASKSTPLTLHEINSDAGSKRRPRRRKSGSTTGGNGKKPLPPGAYEDQPPPNYTEPIIELRPRKAGYNTSEKLRWQWWGGGASGDEKKPATKKPKPSESKEAAPPGNES